MSGYRETLTISQTMAPRHRSAGTPIFVCLGTCRTPCGVAKHPAFSTCAIRDHSIIKFIRCLSAKNKTQEPTTAYLSGDLDSAMAAKRQGRSGSGVAVDE